MIDPELRLDIVMLGMIYDIARKEGRIRVTRTLTAPGSPMRTVVGDGIRCALDGIPRIHAVDVAVMWDAAWHPVPIASGVF